MRSRVVPGRSKTSEMSRPARQLKRADLPTLGRPTIATVCSIIPLFGRLRAGVAAVRKQVQSLPHINHGANEGKSGSQGAQADGKWRPDFEEDRADGQKRENSA